MFQMDVMEVALDQCGTAGERRLAIIDKNRDLHLTSVRVFGTDRKTVKLGMYSTSGFNSTKISYGTLNVGSDIDLSLKYIF